MMARRMAALAAALAVSLLAAGGRAAAAAGSSRLQLLHLSDVHLNLSESLDASESAAIPIRYFADAPVALLESALAFAQQHAAPQPDLLLYTGDHAAHGEFSDAYIATAVRTNVGLLEKYYPPSEDDAPALEATAIIGNADGSTFGDERVVNYAARVEALTCSMLRVQTRTTTWT